MPLPLPPIEEQHEIVRLVTNMLRKADDLLAELLTAAKAVERSEDALLAYWILNLVTVGR